MVVETSEFTLSHSIGLVCKHTVVTSTLFKCIFLVNLICKHNLIKMEFWSFWLPRPSVITISPFLFLCLLKNNSHFMFYLSDHLILLLNPPHHQWKRHLEFSMVVVDWCLHGARRNRKAIFLVTHLGPSLPYFGCWNH